MTKADKEISTSTDDWKISGRVLVVPDIHQDLTWVHAIIEGERGNYDHIVFLGDFFDSFWEPPKVSSVGETASFVLDIINGKYGPCTMLAGNHELPHIESWRANKRNRNPKNLLTWCSGHTNSKAKVINKILSWEDWKKFKLFALCNGWLLTHAGLQTNNFRPFIDPEKSLRILEQEFNEAINHIGVFHHHLFAAGIESGGGAPIGGPLWLRPQCFEDELPYPQIFGHTHTGKGIVKQYGRSFCLDGGQTVYAIIQPDGNVDLKSYGGGKIQNATVQKWRMGLEQVQYVETNLQRARDRQPMVLNDSLFPKITQQEWDRTLESLDTFDKFTKIETQWIEEE